MADPDENAAIVNAIQRHASVVVQKSLAEGFGLTVAEAMWKRKPVVASAVGGIVDQIEDGTHGLLVQDPTDLRGVRRRRRVAAAGSRRTRRGWRENGRRRVIDEFLGDRHLEQYGLLFEQLSRRTSMCPPAYRADWRGTDRGRLSFVSETNKEADMAAWVWILIALGVLAVLGVIVFGAKSNREKAQRREQAQELRQEADTRTQQAVERERVAEEQVRQAKEARKVAAEVGARADHIDPDSETPEEDGRHRKAPATGLFFTGPAG